MNKLFKILLWVFFVALTVSLIGSLYYYNKINKIYQEDVTYVFDENPEYHYSLIIADNGDIYWQDFKEGAYEAAKANDAAIEMNIVDDINTADTIIEYLDIAGKSKVDGVIVLGQNSTAQDDAINSLIAQGINVVVVGQESKNTTTSYFVGTNNYEYGARAGEFLKETANDYEPINIAVILSADYSNNDKATASSSDIMMTGLQTYIQEHSNMNLLVTKNCDSELLGSEDIVRDILTEYEDVTAIFCTSTMDTEAAARVVVERNLVGQVKIIGTGITESIIASIEKGVVFGTIDKNGYQAGKSSVEFLCNRETDTLQPDFISVDLDVYTAMNIPSGPED
ncbi:MAG: substrate-binding domain-containing protein [Clostridia bacterium]|nr:substrate-binding domain-containing protein [Clostridia bacterium]